MVENNSVDTTTPRPLYQALSTVKDHLNAVAETARQAGSTMDAIGQTVTKMKGVLEGIVKIYPPYPPGSEERVQKRKGLRIIVRDIDGAKTEIVEKL